MYISPGRWEVIVAEYVKEIQYMFLDLFQQKDLCYGYPPQFLVFSSSKLTAQSFYSFIYSSFSFLCRDHIFGSFKKVAT